MTHIELVAMLDQINIEHTHYQFEKGSAPEPPYFVWYEPDTSYEYADDSNHISLPMLNIELYTDYKDFALEIQLESQLKSLGFTWQKTESSLEDEGLYEVLYEIPIIIQEDN